VVASSSARLIADSSSGLNMPLNRSART